MTPVSGTKLLAFAVTAIVVGSLCAAVVLLDPPGVQRQRKMDERRIQDLMSLQRATEEYWTRHKALPPDLATLSKEPGLRVPETDPETGSPYGYEVTGPKSYRLRGVFARDSAEGASAPYYSVKWAHGAGRHCFDLTIPKGILESGSHD
ncbi:MAG: hypothetical protein ACP5XB_05070 [Isosphaeraceae bacterium]